MQKQERNKEVGAPEEAWLAFLRCEEDPREKWD